jgi:hypothetical protein
MTQFQPTARLDDTGSKTYGYFTGDAFVFVNAKTEAAAASVLQLLP